jgi:TonB family protein
MAEATTMNGPVQGASSFLDEAASLLVGAGFTLGVFLCVAHFERAGPSDAQPEIEDLRIASAYVEPPPPKVDAHPEQASVTPPLTGLDISASDSPVKLAVVPPDLDRIIPPTDLPKATIQFNQVFSDLKPRTGSLGDTQHVYQQSEVDQIPVAVTKTIARVSRNTRDNAESLKVTLLLVIDTDGAVTSIRVLKPSGNTQFDSIVLDCVRDEWVFTPAIRKGHKVKCMVQQLVWYKWTEGSKFTL